MILCDIGNTTFHFFDTKKQISQRIFLDETIDSKYKNKKIYYISVNGKATKKLKSFCKKCVDVSKFFSFNTQYVGMGIDRKVACSLFENAIIVDSGSAITVDVMQNSQHLGGFILPGLRALKEFYPRISKKLEIEFDKKVNLDDLPQNTRSAVSYAVLQSIVLPIENEIKKYEKLPCIITGGNGKFLSKLIPNSQYKKHLLFESMKEIIDANNSTTKG